MIFFRLIAAFLVITIHTSPLSSVNGTADFILTGVIARVAVPFFFMASGFFLLPEHSGNKREDQERLIRFIKKVAVLYAAASLIYLPVNIYAGYFKGKHLFLSILKDIAFNGTFYHLWYLPAAILGASITYLLLERLKTRQVFGITLMLYAIGLFGDSYYGITSNVPLLRSLYNGVFTISDYTRNGLFFAPIFFVLGGIIAKQRRHLGPKVCITGLIISSALMLTEGLILHSIRVQRHDSMYFMLLPCMFFLFQCMLIWKGKDNKSLRDISMYIYLVHPLMIVLVRGFAKNTGLKRLLIDNSMVQFLTVAACSFVAAILIDRCLRKKRGKKINAKKKHMDRAWAEINMDNLNHNVQVLREVLPGGCELMAVVKTNAYGHGDVEIAEYLNSIGVKSFAVATIDEGICLRRHGIKGGILILGYTVPERVPEIVRYSLMQTVADYDHAKGLDASGKPLKVHIKVDTGMHRLGEDYRNVSDIKRIFQCKNLKICGIYTHLCAADSCLNNDIEFTKGQIKSFILLTEKLKNLGCALPKTHIQSSYGVLNYPELQCDYARIGIAMYGVLSHPHDKTKLQIDLRPVLSLKARIVLIRTIAPGESVGYGREFTALRYTRIAVLPLGYGDGVPCSFSCGKGEVLIHGYRAPIIGRICMDQLMVDVTDIPDVKKNETATLIGTDGLDKITAEQVSANAGMTTNELLSRLSDRLERVF